jgi:hypothetical protein
VKNVAAAAFALGILLSADQFFYDGRFINPVIGALGYFVSAVGLEFRWFG